MSTLILPPLKQIRNVCIAVNRIGGVENDRYRIRIKNSPKFLSNTLISQLRIDVVKPELLYNRIAFIVTGADVVEGYFLYMHEILLDLGYSTDTLKSKFDKGFVSGLFPKCAISLGIEQSNFEDQVLLFAEYSSSD